MADTPPLVTGFAVDAEGQPTPHHNRYHQDQPSKSLFGKPSSTGSSLLRSKVPVKEGTAGVFWGEWSLKTGWKGGEMFFPKTVSGWPCQ